MADRITTLFNNKKANFDKLVSFGFELEKNRYIYQKKLPHCQLCFRMEVDIDGNIEAKVIDPHFEEPYTLHLVNGATGNFVAEVREDYEKIVSEIAEQCFEGGSMSIVSDVVTYIRESYGDELEYLWDNSKNGVWRRKDNRKWYGALLQVNASKLGIESDEIVDIIDLRIQKGEVERLVDNQYYFPGYHMNKKSWYTIVLDGRIGTDEVCKRIDESYKLANKK